MALRAIENRLMRSALPGFEPGEARVRVRRVETALSDGTVLRGELLLPEQVRAGVPTILIRTPYGLGWMTRLRGALPLASHGFPVLVQAVRGTGGSGGVFEPQLNEQADGIETIRWMRQQPWFTGTLSTFGPSYLGYAQWAVAGRLSRDEPALAPAAMSLSVTTPDFSLSTWGSGAFGLRNALGWGRLMAAFGTPAMLGMLLGPDRRLARALDTLPLVAGDSAAVGRPIPWYQEWLRHEDLRDDYWAQRSHAATVADVTADVLMTTGWNDTYLPWQLQSYEVLASQGRAPLLTIGPWAHDSAKLAAVNATETIELLRDRFEGVASPRSAPVRFFLTGARQWLDAPSWPPPSTRAEHWYLGAQGSLDAAEPTAESSATAYTFDPASPTPATGGPQIRGTQAEVDDRAHEQRDDVVIFTGDPLDSDLDVVGSITATVWMRSDRPSVDVFVRVSDVHPDGRSMSVTDALRRVGSPATAHSDPERADDGAWPIEVTLWPTAHRFAAGHRVRVQISSGAHPRYARNTGSGLLAADDTELHVARQEVLHEKGRASRVSLPVWRPTAT